MTFETETIGDCTLYRADCLEVLPTLEENSVEMIWTDPPYGHSNHDGDLNANLNKKRGLASSPIANDDPDSFRLVLDSMLLLAVRVLKDDCCCCCCCGGGGGPRPTFAWVADRLDREGFSFFHSVIWDKKNPGLGWRYRRQHEMIMIAHLAGGKLLWRDNTKAERNVIAEQPARERVHPNEKPLSFVSRFIENHSSPGHKVLDPFMGSGTTGVACVNLGRKFIGIELEPKYFDIACERISEAYKQPRLFEEPAPKPVQETFLKDSAQ